MTRLRQRGVVAIVAMLAISVGVAYQAAAADNKAVVHGASKLFVRRGPGMSFPPFARLSEGSIVKVHDRQGSWVRIETAGGQVGFVNQKFLTPVGEGELADAAPPTEAELLDTPTAAATAAVTPAAVETQSTTAPTPGAGGRRRANEATASLAETPSGSTLGAETPLDTPTRPTMADERVSIADEVRRLSEAVVVLEKRIGESEPIGDGFGDGEADEENSVSGGAILLTLLGIGFGWYVGSRYGRAQERGRRSRIRF